MSRGFAYVEFEEKEAVGKALQCDGAVVEAGRSKCCLIMMRREEEEKVAMAVGRRQGRWIHGCA